MGGMENKSEFFFLFYSFIFLDFVNSVKCVKSEFFFFCFIRLYFLTL